MSKNLFQTQNRLKYFKINFSNIMDYGVYEKLYFENRFYNLYFIGMLYIL